MHDDFTFDLETTVPLMLDYKDELATCDVIAEIRVVTEMGDRWWEVTNWRYRAGDGTHKSLNPYQNTTSPKAWLWACCEAHAKDDFFKQCVEDEIVSKCGRLPDENAEHRLTQRDLV